MNPYKVLGVEKDATLKQIKYCYRVLCQKNHPDKGGSKKKFQMIAEAYKILGNRERRKQYDETGSTEENRDEQIVQSKLAELFNAVIEEGRAGDIIKECRAKVKDVIAQMKRQKKEFENALIKLDRQKERVSSTGEINLYQSIIEQKIAGIKRGLLSMANENNLAEKMLEALEEYKDEKPIIPPAFSTGASTRTGYIQY